MEYKDGQLFRVKVINSEKDLPKDKGEIIYHRIDSSGMPSGITKGVFDPIDKLYWIHHMDYYLIPEPEKPKSTIESPDFFEQKIEDEITDSDIEAWAEKKVLTDLIEDIYETDVSFKECLIISAKAILNREIKHIKK